MKKIERSLFLSIILFLILIIPILMFFSSNQDYIKKNVDFVDSLDLVFYKSDMGKNLVIGNLTISNVGFLPVRTPLNYYIVCLNNSQRKYFNNNYIEIVRYLESDKDIYDNGKKLEIKILLV